MKDRAGDYSVARLEPLVNRREQAAGDFDRLRSVDARPGRFADFPLGR
jgi:hypothetical protein